MLLAKLPPLDEVVGDKTAASWCDSTMRFRGEEGLWAGRLPAWELTGKFNLSHIQGLLLVMMLLVCGTASRFLQVGICISHNVVHTTKSQKKTLNAHELKTAFQKTRVVPSS